MGMLQRLLGSRAKREAQDAQDPVVDMNRAVQLFRAGAFAKALAIADQLIAAGPEIALSWRFRGECLFSLQRYDEAVVSFDQATQLGGPGTSESFLWSALALHNGGKRDQARARLTAALATSTLTPELREQTESALKTLETSP